ncbi:MAG: hypothetical protein HY909_23755 [Deltaproteobacteria bacterium]|nr:hypothetical protein [Deltaproteobacteria bacterium]
MGLLHRGARLAGCLVGLLFVGAGCTSEALPAGQCVFDSDCESPLVCAGRFCRAACRTDADCAQGSRCAVSGGAGRGTCVAPGFPRPCLFASDCPAPQVCSREGLCQAQCQTDYDCQVVNPFETCADRVCALRCAERTADCDGDPRNGCEAELLTSGAHCGRCGNACASTVGATARCAEGRCGTACMPGRGDCDGMASNGCEADLTTSDNCGACGLRCAGEAGLCQVDTDRATGAQRAMCVRSCLAGTSLCGGRCADLTTDPQHCGACGVACAAGPGSAPACVGGRCALRCEDPERSADCDGAADNGCEATLRTSAAHCGECGNACAGAPNASGACVEGRCGITCAEGFGDCDGMPGNGCETDLRASGSHCGRCGEVCPARANATAQCAAARCGVACAAGFGDCDGAADNGCETDTSTAVAHCGACGRGCEARPGAIAECAAGLCRYRCQPGALDCDGNLANGCEVTAATDPAHCGGCGRACSRGRATATCAAGVCGLRCDPGFGDCDGEPGNGCETDTSSNSLHCGACRMACAFPGAGARCDAGRCVRTTCAAGRGDCDGNSANGCETDTAASADHCGGCGARCALPNATARCAGSRCAVASCVAGFGDCDGNPANGCEVNFATDPLHCGSCPLACSASNGAPSCVGGSCRITCAAGFGDCDGAVANGCETSTATTAAHCGACMRVCALPNAAPSCVGGACQVASCAAGFGDCDRSAGNGCETNLQTTAAACGACGRACALPNATAACSGGLCRVAGCAAGFGNCDGMDANGCEVNTATALGSCGACGRACAVANGTPTCAGGVCRVAACNAGFGNCDGADATGCETDTNSSNAHCGACGRDCGPGTGCTRGACSSVCTTPPTFCAGSCVDTTTNPAHCGGCGMLCPARPGATATCARSACGFTCTAGLGDCDGDPANGCETNVLSALAHCGACRAVCSRPNASPRCSGGVCSIGSCNTGFGNCDGNDANGCEADTQTQVAHCGGCGRACALPNATPACRGGGCVIASCNTGFGDCDGMNATGCETDLGASDLHCGACRRACAAGTRCAAGLCVPVNDTPGTATAVDLARTRVDLPFVNVNANTTVPVSTACASSSGADVFFRFDLTRQEVIYADTLGAGFDTVLFLAVRGRLAGSFVQYRRESCEGTFCTPLSPLPGELFCNDDMTRGASEFGPGCGAGGNASMIAAILGPGTYFLGVAGYGTATGTGTVHFEHLPYTFPPYSDAQPSYIPNVVTGGQYRYTRVPIAGASAYPATCGLGAGPEHAYWWRSCPEATAVRFRANTCPSIAVTDTVLDLRHGSGAAGACNDDQTGCVAGTRSSYIDTTLPVGAGLHVLTMDTYAAPPMGSSYSMVINEVIIGRGPWSAPPRACGLRFAQGAWPPGRL